MPFDKFFPIFGFLWQFNSLFDIKDLLNFGFFDDNNDGSIDMKEMKKFVKDITVLLSPSELETIQEEDGINVAFSEMDKNNDGKVSEDEFVSAILAKEKIATMLALKIVDILSPDNCC